MSSSKPERAESFYHLIYLYGPPGSGKTSIGKVLAGNLGLPFIDLDLYIEEQVGMSIPEIFNQRGESGFRQFEKDSLQEISKLDRGVIALGGGSLLDRDCWRIAENSGSVVCLHAPLAVLYERLSSSPVGRPLLMNGSERNPQNSQLAELLKQRSLHYASFDCQVSTESKSPEQVALEMQIRLGVFHVRGMDVQTKSNHRNQVSANKPGYGGYDVRVASALDNLGEAVTIQALSGPVVLVSDQNVAEFYLDRVERSFMAAGYSVKPIILPPGEKTKTMDSVSNLWQEFLSAGLERDSTVVALGGGVIGDLVGFASATYMRGAPWINIPTSLLAMADASLGGKTGVDLPAGKNLVGAFHAPKLVLADPSTLETLPRAELVSGMAEVIKAGVIGDPVLFQKCAAGWPAIEADWDEILCRAMAVKIQVIEIDPYEQGLRAALNFGHSIGHAVEVISGYELRHGEAVAIGMVSEARIAERIGIAREGLAEEIKTVCELVGLPVEIPGEFSRSLILETMQLDKKRKARKVRFALPREIGDISIGIEVNDIQHLI